MIELADLAWIVVASVGTYVFLALGRSVTRRKIISDKLYVISGFAGQFASAALIARYGLGLPWLAVCAACLIWTVPLAVIAMGSGPKAETRGWAIGLGLLFTLPAVTFAALVVKAFVSPAG